MLARGWNHKIDIKQYLGEDDSNAAVVIAANGVIKELLKLPQSLNGLQDAISEFEDVADSAQYEDGDYEWVDEFNYTLDKLYDWANDERVWLGL